MSVITWSGYDLTDPPVSEETVSIECYESLGYELHQVCSFIGSLGCTPRDLEDIINGTEEQRMAVWYKVHYNYT